MAGNIDGCTGITTINKKWLGHSSCCVCFSHSRPLSHSACVLFFCFHFSYPNAFVSLWTISFPEREKYVTRASIYTTCHCSFIRCAMRWLQQQLFFHHSHHSCASCTVSCHVLHIYFFAVFFFSTVSFSFVSAIVNYVHNMYALMWVYGYGFNTIACFLFCTANQYECQLQKAQEVRP